MVEKEELQKKVLAYRILEARLNGLIEQRKALVEKIAEIQLTQSSMDEIKANVEILVPLGAEAYILGKILEKNKVIVEIGAGIALEKSFEEAKQLLERRKEEMGKVLSQVESSIAEVSVSLEKLGPEIEELAEKLR